MVQVKNQSVFGIEEKNSGVRAEDRFFSTVHLKYWEQTISDDGLSAYPVKFSIFFILRAKSVRTQHARGRTLVCGHMTSRSSRNLKTKVSTEKNLYEDFWGWRFIELKFNLFQKMIVILN